MAHHSRHVELRCPTGASLRGAGNTSGKVARAALAIERRLKCEGPHSGLLICAFVMKAKKPTHDQHVDSKLDELLREVAALKASLAR